MFPTIEELREEIDNLEAENAKLHEQLAWFSEREPLVTNTIEENDKLRGIIKGALRIESLWMPPDEQNDPNHDEEFAALCTMRQSMTEAVLDGSTAPTTDAEEQQ